MAARKLTVTFEDGTQISRRTENDYTHVATNGFHATWHTRKDLAEKSARPKAGWKVYEVDQKPVSQPKVRVSKSTDGIKDWKERQYAGVMIEGREGGYNPRTGRMDKVEYIARAFGVVMRANTVEELIARIDRKLEERDLQQS